MKLEQFLIEDDNYSRFVLPTAAMQRDGSPASYAADCAAELRSQYAAGAGRPVEDDEIIEDLRTWP